MFFFPLLINISFIRLIYRVSLSNESKRQLIVIQYELATKFESVTVTKNLVNNFKVRGGKKTDFSAEEKKRNENGW